MAKAIIALSAIALLLFGVLVFADVDTRDGTAIQDSTNLDGFTSNLDDADGQVIKTAAGGCDTDVDTGDFSSGWTIENGSWTLDSTDASHTADAEDAWIHSDTQTTTTKHWAKVQVTATNSYDGLMLCGEGDGADKYGIMVDSGTLHWYSYSDDTTSNQEDTDTITFSANDYIAAATECAAAGAVAIDWWVNPSGGCPSEWGAADGQLSATPTYRATGKYVGIFSYGQNANYDNFSAGDW